MGGDSKDHEVWGTFDFSLSCVSVYPHWTVLVPTVVPMPSHLLLADEISEEEPCPGKCKTRECDVVVALKVPSA